jgi:hypothetical protein
MTEVGELFSMHINRCDVCMDSFNKSTRRPMLICSMHHTLCEDCLHSIVNATCKCPFCREFINPQKIVVNNYIADLLPDDPINK